MPDYQTFVIIHGATIGRTLEYSFPIGYAKKTVLYLDCEYSLTMFANTLITFLVLASIYQANVAASSK